METRPSKPDRVTMETTSRVAVLGPGNKAGVVVFVVLCDVYSTPHFIQSGNFPGTPLVHTKQGQEGGNYMFETQKYINR